MSFFVKIPVTSQQAQDRSSSTGEGASAVSNLMEGRQARVSTPVRNKDLLVLGTRGIPARHGGFETFAQQLALYVSSRGRSTTVYCQAKRSEIGGSVTEDDWNGVHRVFIPSRDGGSLASIAYDMRCILHAARRPGTILLLGYNTAVFAVLLKLLGRNVIINMDGLEWKRPKWSRLARSWLWMNERIASMIGTTLVADHPEIKSHLVNFTRSSKVVMIPYGADLIETASVEPILEMGLQPHSYYVCIARIEPENSQLEIVKAFSKTKRNKKLVVLGKLDDSNAYHRAVRAEASNEVMFVGAIYDKAIVSSLRFHAAAYCHGHTVGGTNPSLVEALGAGCPIIAHDNAFNRWTAGSEQLFFAGSAECADVFDLICAQPQILDSARKAAKQRHNTEFQLDYVLAQHERLIGFDLQDYCQYPHDHAYWPTPDTMRVAAGATIARERAEKIA